MNAKRLNTVTDRCILTGRTFSHEAEKMATSGRILRNDPRFFFRNEAYTKTAPQTLTEIKKQWDEFLERVPIPLSATASILLGQSILTRKETNSVQRDLATCLESAALHIHKKNPNHDSLPDYVGMASKLCDGIVLSMRHIDNTKNVSSISEAELIPPQLVLAGMMRVGLVDHRDFRISAFIEGEVGDVNSLSRKEYYNHARSAISQGMRAASNVTIKDPEKKQITSALTSLRNSRNPNLSYVNREVSVLNANAKLSENIGISLTEDHDLLRKQLAGVSMSSSARAIAILEENPLKRSIEESKKKEHKGR
jgi:hypothetical protein